MYDLLKTYHYGINNERVREGLLKYGISTVDNEGNKVDSLYTLFSIIHTIEVLYNDEDYIQCLVLIDLVVGIRNRGVFIYYLLKDRMEIDGLIYSFSYKG